MRIPTQVTPKQGKRLDIILYVGAALLLGPMAIGLAPVILTLAVLWPLLILPIIMFQRAFPRGEEYADEQFDRAVDSVRPSQWGGRQAHAH